jgi:hypothetical protein
MAAGFRAAAGLRVDIGHAAPSPAQLFWLLALAAAVELGLARLAIPGAAVFHVWDWLSTLYGTAFLVFLVWATLGREPAPASHPAPVSAWLGLFTVAAIPLGAIGPLFAVLTARELLPFGWLNGVWLAWLLYGLVWVWLLLVTWRVTGCFAPSHGNRARMIVGVLLIQAIASWQPSSGAWQIDYAAQDAGAHPSLTLSQEVFEDQQTLLSDTLAALAPRQANRINVFGLVYAPYAQSVFVRESALVTGVLQQRFGAAGHVVQLVNHPSVTETLPWATPLNLRDSLQAIAEHMDREHDVLVVYLDSHGGADFKLASSHWPLAVEELTPQALRSLLDEVGVRNRVIAVSACYSGGWIAPLAGDTTLVMTAADATHTSYGCGSKSDLTFFGRALFDEQLRKTYSFEQAFLAAVPVIQQREIDGNKADGFSNPQIAVGKDIRLVLADLEKQLRAAPPPALALLQQK